MSSSEAEVFDLDDISGTESEDYSPPAKKVVSVLIPISVPSPHVHLPLLCTRRKLPTRKVFRNLSPSPCPNQKWLRRRHSQQSMTAPMRAPRISTRMTAIPKSRIPRQTLLPRGTERRKQHRKHIQRRAVPGPCAMFAYPSPTSS